MNIPNVLIEYAEYLEKKTSKTFPALAQLAKQCYLNTIETTVKKCDNGDYFVITGDIPALWLRDSAAQLRPYIPLCPKSEALSEIIRGVIRRHAYYIILDPYSNAFNETPFKSRHQSDKTDFYSDYIWERKYEVDSLCASVYLLFDYYSTTGDRSVLTGEVRKMLQRITDTFITEQDHEANSDYYFIRENVRETDTLPMNGKGNPVAVTGMTWSGFRPSDDRCIYPYLIPANMMCAVAMEKAAFIFENGYSDAVFAEKCRRLCTEVRDGIKRFGTVNHPVFGEIYAYETDGLGHHLLMDDANSPSLLSLPYIGWCDKNDPIYQNTRRFILSEQNPFYFKGKAAKGIGSPHTGNDMIWHISLIMQILTTDDPAEKNDCLQLLADTHAGTCFMHESFNKDDPANYTRSWFAWANALFAQMLSTI